MGLVFNISLRCLSLPYWPLTYLNYMAYQSLQWSHLIVKFGAARTSSLISSLALWRLTSHISSAILLLLLARGLSLLIKFIGATSRCLYHILSVRNLIFQAKRTEKLKTNILLRLKSDRLALRVLLRFFSTIDGSSPVILYCICPMSYPIFVYKVFTVAWFYWAYSRSAYTIPYNLSMTLLS